MSPNDKYASLVAACGYLPLVLRGEDYLELLPVAWRAVNDYGIRIGYRTYDCAELGPYRRQHSGITAKRGLWEVHYDPYDLSQVFVRTQQGWITGPWVHLPLVTGHSPTSPGSMPVAWPPRPGWTTSMRRRSPAFWTNCSPAASTVRTPGRPRWLAAPASLPPSVRRPRRPRPRRSPNRSPRHCLPCRWRISASSTPRRSCNLDMSKRKTTSPAGTQGFDGEESAPPDNPLITKEGWGRFVGHRSRPDC
ncbi:MULTISPECIES: Mu transposase C-terminal domain-containing protein [Streptomyces]|uniref:Mu transposase C-terminal domain-containing protein n=1 Tax=Streptomyces TaxID=1883 RepID=UPI0019B0BFB2|nr:MULTISPECIES: Mu transposase C-terminal domain-containing protein [Streptomyces]GGS97829.1 hypothetical protein GCM10010286_23500 [Streptomyces toxytricini]